MIVKEAQDWKDLQNKVHFILESIGLSVGKEVPVSTPRGSIEIDVFAIDPNSVDKIKYVIECKHWNTIIPQQVIHSFTTVMHETGANIGYIISKKGFRTERLIMHQIRIFAYFPLISFRHITLRFGMHDILHLTFMKAPSSFFHIPNL